MFLEDRQHEFCSLHWREYDLVRGIFVNLRRNKIKTFIEHGKETWDEEKLSLIFLLLFCVCVYVCVLSEKKKPLNCLMLSIRVL